MNESQLSSSGVTATSAAARFDATEFMKLLGAALISGFAISALCTLAVFALASQST